jgi:hypothetical protein
MWGNLWTNDQIVKYDPGSSKWTIFELPVRGTEIRLALAARGRIHETMMLQQAKSIARQLGSQKAT